MKNKLILGFVTGIFASVAPAVPMTTFMPSANGEYKNEFILSNVSLSADSDFTWEAWVKIPASAASLAENRVFGQTDWVSEGRLVLEVRNHSTTGKVPKFALLYRVNSANQRLIAEPEIVVDTWTHVAVTRVGANLKIYVNGVMSAEASDYTKLTRGAPFLLAPAFAGSLSDVRVWKVARTESEIAVAKDLRDLGTATGLVANWNMDTLPKVVKGYNVQSGSSAYVDSADDRVVLAPADVVVAGGETRTLQSATELTGLVTVRKNGVLDLHGIGNTSFRLRLEDGAKLVNNTANLGGNVYQLAGGVELAPGATAVFESGKNSGFRADEYAETHWSLNGGTLIIRGRGLVYYSNVRNSGGGTIRYESANFLMDYTNNASGSNDFSNVTFEIGSSSTYQVSFANVLGSLLGSGKIQYKNGTLNGVTAKYAQVYVEKRFSGLLTFGNDLPVKILSGGTLDLTQNTGTYSVRSTLTFGDEAVIDVRGRTFADGDVIMSWSKNPLAKFSILGLAEDQMAIATSTGLVVATTYKTQVSGNVSLSAAVWTPELPEGYDVSTTLLVVESAAPNTVITHDLSLAKANLKVICSAANPTELRLGAVSYPVGSTSRFAKAGDGTLVVSRTENTQNVGGNLVEAGELKVAQANHYAIPGGHLAVYPGATLDINQSSCVAKLFMMDGAVLKNSGGNLGAASASFSGGIELARDAEVTADLAYNAGIRNNNSTPSPVRELRLNGGKMIKRGAGYFLCSAVLVPDEGTIRVEEGQIFFVANAVSGFQMPKGCLELIGDGLMYIGHKDTLVGTIVGTGIIKNTLADDELKVAKGFFGSLRVETRPLNLHLADGVEMCVSSGAPSLGTLTLDGSALIRADDGVTLAFANSSAATWQGELALWAAPYAVSFGTSQTGLTQDQISKIVFNGGRSFKLSNRGAIIYPGLAIILR